MKLLIIPWYNYQMKYVNKYVKEYIKLGIKKENIDIFEYKNPYTIRDAYKIYKTNTIQNKKYDIIHTFSGGSLVLGFLRMSDNYNFDKVIFDSGPMFPTNRCTYNYLTNLYNIPKIFENTLHNIISKNRILHLNNEEKQFMFQMENNFERSIFPEDKHKLLFNSPKDNLILLDDILKLNDKNTQHVIYDNSDHVQHMKYNKDHYIQTVYDFIKK
jgi:hypothetical protein